MVNTTIPLANLRGIFGMISTLMLWSGACIPSAQPDIFPSQNPCAYASSATSSTATLKFLPLLLQSYEHPSWCSKSCLNYRASWKNKRKQSLEHFANLSHPELGIYLLVEIQSFTGGTVYDTGWSYL